MLIVSGGKIPSNDFLRQSVTSFQPRFIIAADSGADILFENKITPDILLGDFDSVREDALNYFRGKCEIIALNKEKDETDTESALLKAHELGAKEIVIIGGTGNRLDHTFANLYLLKKAEDMGMHAVLADERQQIFLVRAQKEFHNMKGRGISLFSFCENITGITTHGFYYPLNGEKISMGDVRGISNVISEDDARVEIKSGLLLIILNQF